MKLKRPTFCFAPSKIEPCQFVTFLSHSLLTNKSYFVEHIAISKQRMGRHLFVKSLCVLCNVHSFNFLSSNIEKVFATFFRRCLFLPFSEIQYRAGFVGIVGLKQRGSKFQIFYKNPFFSLEPFLKESQAQH